MSRRLVTIASFDLAAQARLAHNILTEAGIKSTISDETLVAMDWLLSNAVGGVKVQVWEEDAERAVAALEEKLGKNGEGLGGAVSLEELTAQAEAATPEEGEEPEPEPFPTPSQAAVAPSPEPDETPPLSERDTYAQRVFFMGWLSFGFPPLMFLAFYYLLNALFGSGSLSRRGWHNVILGCLLMSAWWALGLVGWYLYFGPIWFIP